MKAKAKQPAGRKVAPVIAEYSGELVASNVWYKLGFSPDLSRAMRAMAVEWWGPKAKASDLARTLIRIALANPEAVAEMAWAMEDYSEAEGFESFHKYLLGRIAQRFPEAVAAKGGGQ